MTARARKRQRKCRKYPSSTDTDVHRDHSSIRGIMNLERCKQKVEIRFVIHKQTFEGLPQTARFIARNLQ